MDNMCKHAGPLKKKCKSMVEKDAEQFIDMAMDKAPLNLICRKQKFCK